jgi:serine protease Do
VAFEGADVQDTRDLVRRVGNTEIGSTVDIVVFRNGETETLAVTLGRREDAERAVPASVNTTEPIEGEALGLSVSEMTDELREQLGLATEAGGLVVTDVAGDSEAYEKGVRAGDVITEAGQQPVATVTDLEDRIAEAKEAGRKSLLLLVRREGDPRFVALSVE